tara:strand:- start:407 stop:967 length:561 start_codon:yes stop_codon:yes gene_type:complete
MNNSQQSSSNIVASSGVFQIEFLKETRKEDFGQLISISSSLENEFGSRAVLTDNTIKKYFNHPKSLPFIARYRNEIIGYIIGIPLEALNQEPWVRTEENFGKMNTLYTYAFIIMEDFKKNGYAKMLKKVYLSRAEKIDNIEYITGHVAQGVSSRFKGNIELVGEIKNWQGTNKTFEYYRRYLKVSG